MVFSSVTFLFYFLPIFLACYVLTPTVAAKNVVTLLFSLVFYAWGEPRFLLILLFSIAFNYVAAIVVDRTPAPSRKWALAVAVAVNLLVLGLFKYANFVTANSPLSSSRSATISAAPTSSCRSASRSSPSIA